MPVTPTHPGVYIEEVPSLVRTIVGVSTSITAFVGRAERGPVNEPRRIQSFAEFERVFGGLWPDSMMSYAVHHFFLNGGSDALVVRIHRKASAAEIKLATDNQQEWIFRAASEGLWGDNLRLSVDHWKDHKKVDKFEEDSLFNLYVDEIDPTTKTVRISEVFRKVSADEDDSRYVGRILDHGSSLLAVKQKALERPKETPVPIDRETTNPADSFVLGSDGDPPEHDEYAGAADPKTGIYALEKADLFNLLYIPPPAREADLTSEDYGDLLDQARAYCKTRRAMLIVDAPLDWTPQNADQKLDDLFADENACVYFPRLMASDPLRENGLEAFGPGGAVAGIFARTDAQRGVWKAPAGLEATLVGARELEFKLTDGEQGRLNPLGINCIRTFPNIGPVVWGARTLQGSDWLASQWKYIPVRRLALFLEESLYRGTQWVVFEPNDEPLWSQIRLNVGSFMHSLFRQGAFQGTTPQDAYFVKCDKETTTQDDINRGIVNILVGFAPLKPAEFVIIRISQMAGQIQT